MLCDHEGCREAAVYSYVWDWGQSGHVCAQHVTHLQQRAKALKRSVATTPIDVGKPAPVSRDERVTYRAQIMARDDELEATKVTMGALQQSNTQLANECRRLEAQNQVLTQTQRDLQAKVARATEQRESTLRDLGELKQENERLRVLAQAAQPT